MKIIICIYLILILYLILVKNNYENVVNDITKNYICFLCVNLSNELIVTSHSMLKYGYKVFIMVDNNNIKYPSVIQNINILQMDDKKCIKLGYKNASATLKKNPVTWDKVFYYFSNIDTNFNNIWFFEEDVFIPRFDLIKDLDEKYKNEDLLCKQDIAEATDTIEWHWNRAKGKIEKPKEKQKKIKEKQIKIKEKYKKIKEKYRKIEKNKGKIEKNQGNNKKNSKNNLKKI